MFIYDKKLQYSVKIDKPNSQLTAIIISPYGGPDGELGGKSTLSFAALLYAPRRIEGLLTDISTEESVLDIN